MASDFRYLLLSPENAPFDEFTFSIKFCEIFQGFRKKIPGLFQGFQGFPGLQKFSRVFQDFQGPYEPCSLYQEQHEINDSRVCRVYIPEKKYMQAYVYSHTHYGPLQYLLPKKWWFRHPSWMEFHECTANAICLQSNHRVTMHGDDGQIRESVSVHCRSQPGVESAETGEWPFGLGASNR